MVEIEHIKSVLIYYNNNEHKWTESSSYPEIIITLYLNSFGFKFFKKSQIF